MGYVLYGANGSGSSLVEAALAELGVAYDMTVVDIANAAQREAAYASVNPHRKLPTLVTPDGETLTESAAIILTLTERHPEPALLPAAGSPARARALRWMVFAVSELYPLIEIVDYPGRFSPDEGLTSGLRDRALELWRSRWRTVEGALQGDGPYLLGERFCITDVYLAALSRWDLSAEWRAANTPTLERLAWAVARRPALREIFRRNFKME